MHSDLRRRAEHVVVVSIDGLKPEYYLDERRPTPAIRSLMRRGAHAAAVRAIFPSLTYPSHVTMVTGALPARHGVCANQAIEPVENPPWLKDASLIRVPALWDVVRDAGGTTASLNWPITVGGAIDWNLPDVWPGSDDAVVRAMAEASEPAGLLAELEREAAGKLKVDNFSSDLLAHDLRLAAMAAYLFEQHRPTLLLVHLEAVVQIPQRTGWGSPRRASAIACADVVVASLLEAIERAGARDDTAIVVAGDHGMTEVHTQLRPNVWLVRAGLRPESFTGDDDWDAFFHALGGSSLLRVRPPVVKNAAAVRRILEELPPGIRQALRIVERDELDALGSDADSPFALAVSPGFVLDRRAEGPDLQPNPGMSHGHHPDEPDMNTGFVAAGPGVRPGAVAPVLPLTAVAPFIAGLLGLDLAAPDGELYPGLLDD